MYPDGLLLCQHIIIIINCKWICALRQWYYKTLATFNCIVLEEDKGV